MGVIGPPIGATLLEALPIRWVLVIGSIVALLGVAVFAVAGAGRGRPGRLRAVLGRLRDRASSIRTGAFTQERR